MLVIYRNEKIRENGQRISDIEMYESFTNEVSRSEILEHIFWYRTQTLYLKH